ncbi:LamB/YcsF family protein [Cellulomonas alba]|uniref:5-oxoprolinase subunit PxpA n=1 Tax=Cellulomonas alba TaxID=3053467 RepID=A0ABT7SFZ3_9CELL|nr:5-oxoprolinase subunit PxpA [Cellulomonas alba]MDM7854462.1 5-oxoprolinase subunit PxpA [Cellulomonas alba]
MRTRIDLNCDLGEGLDPWRPGEPGLDARLLDVVTSANVACGGHAGDERTMAAVCRAAVERGVAIGAHPSYVDREHFGRRSLAVAPHVLRAQVAEQVAALVGIAREAGGRVAYMKPHGALYNVVARDEEQAVAVLDGVADVGALPVVGLPGSAVLRLAHERGWRAVAEGFADRGYRPDGALSARSDPGALVTDPDEVAARVVAMAARGEVTAVDGSRVALDVDTLCVHSDTPGAVALAQGVRQALTAAGLEVGAFA